MINPGKTPSDTRKRPSRVAPRRHVNIAEPAEVTTYDSSEYPVLLRMPDVSRAIHGGELPEQAESQDSVSEHDTSGTRRNRHNWMAGGSGKANSSRKRDLRSTASAAARFWSAIPPQVASGGMLLAVIALCFVLLRDSNTATPPVDTRHEWSGGDLQAKTPPVGNTNVADVPLSPVPHTASPKTTELHPDRESVATKPASPIFQEPTPAKRPPSAVNDDQGAWPTLPPDGGSDTSPVDGWPADVGTVPEDDGTMLNPPLESARRLGSSTRTALREKRLQLAPSMPQSQSANARLDGTVQPYPSTTQTYLK